MLARTTMLDDLFIKSPDGIISKYLKVFKEILEHTENAGHYNIMIEISERY
ncbi:hypothetical protein D3C85_569580 [compost metagenome]